MPKQAAGDNDETQTQSPKDHEQKTQNLLYVIKDGGVDCKVFLDKMMIDNGTMKQIKHMIQHPSVSKSKIRIMPDCHHGKGCCIGFSAHLSDKIVPSFIGNDIGCGILTYNVGKINESLEDMDNFIRANIPIDSNTHKVAIITTDMYNDMFAKATTEAQNFAKTYKEKFNIDINQYIPSYSQLWLKQKCVDYMCDLENVERGFCTLGKGNHYIEMNIDKNNDLYITIHSGSRSFGQAVFTHHQNKINATKYIDYDDLTRTKKKLERKYKNSKELKKVCDDLMLDIHSNLHPDYLEGVDAYTYYFDMIFAQKYAQGNRHQMLKIILEHLKIDFEPENIIESVHNYIDFNDLILRKGCIAAYSDKKSIVSLNMRDGILICVGKSNSEWNYSSSHGAGRNLNRAQSKSRIKLSDFKKSMQGIYSTSVCNETIDESPFAYKDSDLIKIAISDSVDILEELKPVLNIKALSS